MAYSSSRYDYDLDEQSTLQVIAGYTRNPRFLGVMVLFIILMFTTDASFIFETILGSKNGQFDGRLPNSLLTIDYPYTLLKRVVLDQPLENTDVAFFWHPHKSDEQIVQKVLTSCYGVEVIELDSLDAIKKARQDQIFGQTSKNFAILSPFAREAIEMFTPDHMGRMSCFFRHPLDYDFHESLSRDVDGDTNNNKVVRLLVNHPVGPLGLRQLAIAKQIVRDVCVVATIDKLEESIKRIADYFGWELQATDTCVDDIVSSENPKENYVDHESSSWQSFYSDNQYDCQLYELVQSTWRAQIQTIVPLTKQVNRFQGVVHSENGPKEH
jgi:hypothetical protein